VTKFARIGFLGRKFRPVANSGKDQARRAADQSAEFAEWPGVARDGGRSRIVRIQRIDPSPAPETGDPQTYRDGLEPRPRMIVKTCSAAGRIAAHSRLCLDDDRRNLRYRAVSDPDGLAGGRGPEDRQDAAWPASITGAAPRRAWAVQITIAEIAEPSEMWASRPTRGLGLLTARAGDPGECPNLRTRGGRKEGPMRRNQRSSGAGLVRMRAVLAAKLR
jgi:hypothetical protein